MKRTVLLLLTVCLLLTGCISLDDRAEKGKILRLVKENRELLQQCIEQENFDSLRFFSIVQEIHTYSDHIDFYCGGAGFGPATAYCGFFYTETENMSAIWCAPGVDFLTPSGDGYLWEEENGDNRYYVERICEHYYYYEASF